MSAKMRKRLFDFLKSKDKFGSPITLKYRNESAYKSAIGGVMTLISFSLLIMYFVYLSVGTFQRTNYTVSNSLYKKDLNVDNTTLELNIDNFDIAMRLVYGGKNTTIRDNIDLYFSAYFSTLDFTDIYDQKLIEVLGTDYELVQNDIETEYCTVERFRGSMKSNFEGQKEFICPLKDFKFNLIGSWSTEILKLIEANVDYCRQDQLDRKYPGKNKKCKSKAESDKIINLMSVEIPVLLQYFDEKDFSRNPIKSQINYEVYGNLHPNLSTKYSYKVSENKVTLQDSQLSSLIDNREMSYIDLKFVLFFQNQPDQTLDNPLLSFQFLIDDNIVTKERAVSTILDAFANTGGMMGIVFSLVSILIGQIQESLLQLSLMKKIFLIKEDENKESSKKNQTSKLDQVMTTLNNAFSPEKHNHSQIPSIEDLENIDPGDTSYSNTIAKIIKYIRSLKPFSYGFRDILKYKLRKLCKRKKQVIHKDTLYEEGIAKLEEQFDIVKVMKSLRKIDLIAQITLTKYQHKLLPYMKNNVLGHERLQIQTLMRRKVKKRLYESISRLVHKSDSSKIDKRLLKNLDVIRDTDSNLNNDPITEFDNGARDHRLKLEEQNSIEHASILQNSHQSVFTQIKTIQ